MSAIGTSTGAAEPEQRFDWPVAFDAERLLRQRITAFLELNTFARQLAVRMRDETATDFFEWVDHLVLLTTEEAILREVGFVTDESAETADNEIVLHHPRAALPRVRLQNGPTQNPSVIALRPESVADFQARHNLPGDIERAPLSRYRRLTIAEENGTRLEAVERRAYRGFVTTPHKPGFAEAILVAKEFWQTRQRHFQNASDGFALADRLLNHSIPLIGRDLTCQIFFEMERAYWESHNHAGRLQKFRQDQLGLGWGNHDHHTFRSSRAHFLDLMDFLLKLGFEKRERYYAGAEAGWGTQILEHSVLGLVVCADVDLMPEEVSGDFSASRLPASKLGTVGLWCGLHGESFLDAGMYHLGARFEHPLLRDQLKAAGIGTMNSFSNSEFFQQAFTEGERWPVSRERAQRLFDARLITEEQLEKFASEGMIGSHLENLQRHGGFKGFNQNSASAAMATTDLRKGNFQSVST